MNPFAMALHIEDPVLDYVVLFVKIMEEMRESFPLNSLAVRIEIGVRRVCRVKQAKRWQQRRLQHRASATGFLPFQVPWRTKDIYCSEAHSRGPRVGYVSCRKQPSM